MVAFARAKAKSIFSKIQFTLRSNVRNETNARAEIEELSIQNEKNSNSFLEAIKSGGIWLS